MPVAARSKAWVYDYSNPPGGHGGLSLVSVVYCQVFATGRSLVQISPTECGVSECDRVASTLRRPWLTRGCRVMKKKLRPHSLEQLYIHRYIHSTYRVRGGTVGWGSIPDGLIEILHWLNPSGRTMALGSTQPLTEMNTRVIFGG
jgi:hypothetical protein